MQSAVPKGEGGMLAVLGIEINSLNEIINLNKDNFKCYVANDNSVGQIVVSGKIWDIRLLSEELKKKNIRNINLPVSAPFHCELMKKATEVMKTEINNSEFKKPIVEIISNVTAKPENAPNKIKELLIDQIEKPVRWREIVEFMLQSGIIKFIEIGPGKVLSGLVKRISKEAELLQINEIEDLKKLV